MGWRIISPHYPFVYTELPDVVFFECDRSPYQTVRYVQERTCRRITHGLDRDRDIATVSWTCSVCGGHMGREHRYCPACGAKVVEE